MGAGSANDGKNGMPRRAFIAKMMAAGAVVAAGMGARSETAEAQSSSPEGLIRRGEAAVIRMDSVGYADIVVTKEAAMMLRERLNSPDTKNNDFRFIVESPRGAYGIGSIKFVWRIPRGDAGGQDAHPEFRIFERKNDGAGITTNLLEAVPARSTKGPSNTVRIMTGPPNSLWKDNLYVAKRVDGQWSISRIHTRLQQMNDMLDPGAGGQIQQKRTSVTLPASMPTKLTGVYPPAVEQQVIARLKQSLAEYNAVLGAASSTGMFQD